MIQRSKTVRPTAETQFTLKNATHASFVAQDGKVTTYFRVSTVKPGEYYHVWCLHGDWGCYVDVHGRALTDCHFPDGKQIVNTAETKDTAKTYGY